VTTSLEAQVSRAESPSVTAIRKEQADRELGLLLDADER
jgi:hypothetical protein